MQYKSKSLKRPISRTTNLSNIALIQCHIAPSFPFYYARNGK
uniref:Uncharacterized protein n=1 Tax=Arundo donax TaxID=35708 RepID=A0A0A9B8U4_ARUDO